MEDKKDLLYEDNDEDSHDMRNSNYGNNNINNNTYKSEIQDFLDKETSEPDITYFLSSDPESKEGAEILRKCINYFFEKKWEGLISYLDIGGNFLLKYIFFKRYYFWFFPLVIIFQNYFQFIKILKLI